MLGDRYRIINEIASLLPNVHVRDRVLEHAWDDRLINMFIKLLEVLPQVAVEGADFRIDLNVVPGTSDRGNMLLVTVSGGGHPGAIMWVTVPLSGEPVPYMMRVEPAMVTGYPPFTIYHASDWVNVEEHGVEPSPILPNPAVKNLRLGVLPSGEEVIQVLAQAPGRLAECFLNAVGYGGDVLRALLGIINGFMEFCPGGVIVKQLLGEYMYLPPLLREGEYVFLGCPPPAKTPHSSSRILASHGLTWSCILLLGRNQKYTTYR